MPSNDNLEHLSTEDILAYVTCSADPEDADRVERHIAWCQECNSALLKALKEEGGA